jgi:hypothetical protein
MFFDPLTGASEVVACIGSKEIVGPSVEDGRVILLGRDGPCILDPDTGRREPIEIVAASVNTVHWIGGPSSMTPPLSIDTPTVVVACEMRWRGIGVLDLCARRLRIVADVQSEAVQLLSSSLTDAITLEGSESIVRYDLNDGRREVLFAASSLR